MNCNRFAAGRPGLVQRGDSHRTIRRNTNTMILFLALLLKAHPEVDVYVNVNNGSWHTSKKNGPK